MIEHSFQTLHLQKDTKPKVADVIPFFLDGDTAKRALDFVAYMRSHKMPPAWASANFWKATYTGKVICWVNLPKAADSEYKWQITLDLREIDKYADAVVSAGLQDFIWDNIKQCRHVLYGTCNHHNCAPGVALTRLGRKFEHICHNQYAYEFPDPDDATIASIKTLLALERDVRDKASKGNAQLRAELEKKHEITLKALAPRGNPVEVDLSTMIVQGDIEVFHDDSSIAIRSGGGDNGIVTVETFTGPIKVDLRAQTSRHDIRIHYHNGSIMLGTIYGKIYLHDLISGLRHEFTPGRWIKAGEVVDIEWIIGEEIMSVKVNGNLWKLGEYYYYTHDFKETSQAPAPLRLSTGPESTVTVESLRVTEIT